MTSGAHAGECQRVGGFDCWCSTLSGAFVPLAPAPLSPSAARVPDTARHRALGGVHMVDIRGGARVVRRPHTLRRRSDAGWVKVALQLWGCGVLEQDDRQAALTEGDFAAYVTARPYTFTFAASFRVLVVLCPRSMLPMSPTDLARVTAVPVSGRDGLGGLVSTFLTKLAENGERADAFPSDTANRHLAESLLAMLTASLADVSADPVARSRGTRSEGLLRKVQTYIESHLGQAELSLESIASAHHISVRYLQKLFGRDGTTVTDWIRARRLDNCRRDLVDARFRASSVSAIAARWGMCDAAYFSRCFRARYGLTPTAYRRAGYPVAVAETSS
jgi:AraC-like DNA-binding protein